MIDQKPTTGELSDLTLRDATRVRLLERAKLDAKQRGLPLAAAEGARRLTFSSRSVAGGGMLIALAASLVFAVISQRDASSARERLATVQISQDRVIDSLAAIVETKNTLIAALTGPSVQVMQLTASGARNARALMFWDTAKNRWTFVAHALAPLPPGRTYQVWLVTSDSKISAGTFGVSPAGDGLLEATYALRPADLVAIAVTEEVEGGSPQPTTAPVIAVSAK